MYAELEPEDTPQGYQFHWHWNQWQSPVTIGNKHPAVNLHCPS
jgi:hypothetical protein